MKTKFLIFSALLVAVFGFVFHPAAGQLQPTADSVLSEGKYASDGGPSFGTYGTKTDTSTLTVKAAQGAGVSTYVYQAWCGNTSATDTVALLKYSTTTVSVIKCNSGAKNAEVTYFDPPIKFPANTAVTINAAASVSTAYFYVAGTVAR